jgi:uncharacterized SAM-binding protein YcdF (DUF218 family)
MQAPVDARAIIVLGGGVRDLSWIGLEPEPSDTSLVRTVTGVVFYRARRIPFIVSGGSGDPSQPDIREADAMARVASSLGVPRKDIIIENKARNTIESAKAVKAMFTGKRIILVTSAQHMKRAAGMFAKQGFDVIPAPTEYHGERRGVSLAHSFPMRQSNVSSGRVQYRPRLVLDGEIYIKTERGTASVRLNRAAHGDPVISHNRRFLITAVYFHRFTIFRRSNY